MPTKTRLANNLKAARKSQGLSLNALAKMAGMRSHTINDIELARANPRLSTLEAICFTLHIEVKTLFE